MGMGISDETVKDIDMASLHANLLLDTQVIMSLNSRTLFFLQMYILVYKMNGQKDLPRYPGPIILSHPHPHPHPLLTSACMRIEPSAFSSLVAVSELRSFSAKSGLFHPRATCTPDSWILPVFVSSSAMFCRRRAVSQDKEVP